MSFNVFKVNAEKSHFVLFVLAGVVGLAIFQLQKKTYPEFSAALRAMMKNRCALLLALLGALLGFAFMNGFGFANLIRLLHAFLGAWIGALVGFEIFRQAKGLPVSTLVPLILPLALSLSILRVGCQQGGTLDPIKGRTIKMRAVSDTNDIFVHQELPVFALNYEDGSWRFPVALMESLAFLIFAAACTGAQSRYRKFLVRFGPSAFLIYYGLVRFSLAFLGPPRNIYLKMNLTQWFCLSLIIYALLILDPPSVGSTIEARSVSPERTE